MRLNYLCNTYVIHSCHQRSIRIRIHIRILFCLIFHRVQKPTDVSSNVPSPVMNATTTHQEPPKVPSPVVRPVSIPVQQVRKTLLFRDYFNKEQNIRSAFLAKFYIKFSCSLEFREFWNLAVVAYTQGCYDCQLSDNTEQRMETFAPRVQASISY